jgi:cytochrome P450
MLSPVPHVDDRNCKKFGRVYGIYEGTTPVLVVHDVAVLQQIFQQQFSSFSDRLRDDDEAFDESTAKNHVYANGEDGRHFRQTVARSSANVWLAEMCDRIHVAPLLDKISKSGGKDIRIFDFLAEYLFTATSLSMFGIDMSTNRQFADLMHEMEKLGPAGSPATKLPYSHNWFASRLPFFLSRAIGFISDTSPGMQFFSNLLTGMLHERSSDAISIELRDVTQAFADSVKTSRLSSDQAISACSVIMSLAADGHQELMACMLYELAKNQDQQDLLLQEIERHSDPLTFESMHQMKYMSAMILEILRLYPLEFRVNRHVSAREGVTINGTDIHLPHGTKVDVPVYSLARDPEYWENPETFDPRRFLKENKDNLVPCAYMPFGAGPRICPGIRMTQYLVKRMMIPILKQYRIIDAKPAVTPLARNSVDISCIAKQMTVSFIDRKV